MSNSDPYHEFTHSDPPNLVGRDDYIAYLVNVLTAPSPQAVQLVGLRKMGASAILRFIERPELALARSSSVVARSQYSNPARLRVTYLDCSLCRTPDRFAEWLLNEISRPENSRWQHHPGLSTFFPKVRVPRGGVIHALEDGLDNIHNTGIRPVLLLDHLDQILGQITGRHAAELRSVVRRCAIISAGEVPLGLINNAAVSSLFHSPLTLKYLRPVTPREAEQLLSQPIIKSGVTIHLDTSARRLLLELAGSHPGLILRAGSAWYDVQQTYQDINGGALEELVRLRVKDMLRTEFPHYWRLLKQFYSADGAPELSLRLAKASPKRLKPKDLERRYTALAILRQYGLIQGDEKDGYGLFSTLWADFLKEQEAAQPTSIDARIGTLSPLQQRVLDYLRSRAGEVCSPAEIIPAVFPGRDGADKQAKQTLRQTVSRINFSLKHSTSTIAGKIVNHRGRGYEYQP